jgi:protein involved in polysaccharide export with SLBB domain
VPVTQLRDSIVAVLRTFITDPQVTVEPTLRVAVGGEVRQPNLAWLPPETTIAQAVALAGGATERGRLNRTVLFREGREMRLDLTSPQSAADTIVVHSGDRIVVGRGSNPLALLAVMGSLVAAATSIAVLVRQQ